jgi:hypothetical protein
VCAYVCSSPIFGSVVLWLVIYHQWLCWVVILGLIVLGCSMFGVVECIVECVECVVECIRLSVCVFKSNIRLSVVLWVVFYHQWLCWVVILGLIVLGCSMFGVVECVGLLNVQCCWMCRVVECSVLLNVLGWKMFGDNLIFEMCWVYLSSKDMCWTQPMFYSAKDYMITLTLCLSYKLL